MESQVNNGSLEWFILLQMPNQRVTMAEVVVGFEGPHHFGTLSAALPKPVLSLSKGEKGAGQLMAVTIFPRIILFEDAWASPL